jgi:hypothetical protein
MVIRSMQVANEADKSVQPATFHTLPHMNTSKLRQAEAPLLYVAATLTRLDTRMVERHYYHFALLQVVDTIREISPNLWFWRKAKAAVLVRGVSIFRGFLDTFESEGAL